MPAIKKRVGKVIDQAKASAKQSFKILESIEKETLAKAKTFVKLSGDPKKMTNDKIISSLKKLGVPTQSEVNALRKRIEHLEAQLELHASK